MVPSIVFELPATWLGLSVLSYVFISLWFPATRDDTTRRFIRKMNGHREFLIPFPPQFVFLGILICISSVVVICAVGSLHNLLPQIAAHICLPERLADRLAIHALNLVLALLWTIVQFTPYLLLRRLILVRLPIIGPDSYGVSGDLREFGYYHNPFQALTALNYHRDHITTKVLVRLAFWKIADAVLFGLLLGVNLLAATYLGLTSGGIYRVFWEHSPWIGVW